MDYSLGLSRLKAEIAQTDEDYLTLLSLEARLLSCLDDEKSVGTAETSRVEKARVLKELNALALRTIGVSFNELCSVHFTLSRKSPVVHNLPQPDYGRFIGREREVSSLLEKLQPLSAPQGEWEWPVIIVHGIGGSGKTTLVLEVAWRLVHAYETLPPEERFEAIVWVTAKEKVLTVGGIRPRAHRFRNISDIYDAVASTLGHPVSISDKSVEEEFLLAEMLSRQRTLLVVDNLETVDDSRVEAFLREPPYPTKVVVTSRHRLGELSGLSFPLSGMPQEECLELIERECVKEEQNRVVMSPPEADRLAERTGGIPLAVVWSIGLMRDGYDIETVLRRLGEADTDIVHFCFDHSMGIVRQDSAAHRLLMALSPFEVDASRLMLAIVTGLDSDWDTLVKALSKLERLSLVTRQDDRYTMLPLTRTYVSAELQRHPEFQDSVLTRWQLSSDSVEHFDNLWMDAVYALGDGAIDDFEVSCLKLLRNLCESLKVQLISEEPTRSEHFLVYSCKTEAVFSGIWLWNEMFLLFFKGTKLIDQDADEIRELSRQTRSYSPIPLILVPFFGRQEQQEARVLLSKRLRTVYALDVALFARDDVLRIAASRDPQRAFRQLVLAQIDLRSVSPFVITGPVPDYVFFGREGETRAIVEHIHQASYAVIGGRRVGKTSLLLRLHRVRLPALGFRTLYCDCSVASSYEDFLATPIRDWQPEAPPDAPPTLGDLLESPPTDKPLVLLLDEADKLVPIDRADGWRLFNTLRAWANAGQIQVVLSGERTLRNALRDPSSPLFNFANEMLLGRLSFPAVEGLVTIPMKQLEIDLINDAAIVERIWSLTSGHPNVVQRLCLRLVEWLSERGERQLTLDDVETVAADPHFLENDFLNTYWESATVLEQLISLLLADKPECRTLSTVQDALNKWMIYAPMAEIDEALQRLVDLRSILTRTPDGYEFAIPAFPEILSKSGTSLRDLREVLIPRVRAEQIERRPQFRAGGALIADSPLYIERDADRELLHLAQQMQYVMIIEPRQTGKTSLINRVSHQLSPLGVITVYIDLTTLAATTNEADWYGSLQSRIARQLQVVETTSVKAIAKPTNASSWSNYLEDLSTAVSQQGLKLVIALDEVGALALPWAEGFFQALRGVYNQRAASPTLRNLTFFLVGAFDPRALITDSSISPFNVAQRVQLTDFSISQLNQLVAQLNLDEDRTQQITDRIFYWTSGQPYLCQLLCQYLGERPDPTVEDVDIIVTKVFQEDSTHLSHILRNLQQTPQLVSYLASLQAEQVRFTPSLSAQQNQLYMIGIIKANEDGQCAIRNRIYERALHPQLQGMVTSQRLADFLQANFSEEALSGLCFAFGLNYRDLAGSDKQSRVHSLVEALRAQSRLEDLAKLVRAN